MTKKKANPFGIWLFLIGIVVAVTVGLFTNQISDQTYKIALFVLVVLGIIIGFINVIEKEHTKFLLASLTLVIVSYMGQGVLMIIPQIGKVLGALLVLFVPTTIIVALKIMFELAKDWFLFFNFVYINYIF